MAMSRKSFSGILRPCLASALLAGLLAGPAAAERVIEGRVTVVRDVDTIVVAGTPVRLNGVDGPETGPVTYLCRPQCSFRPLGVRRPRGFCLPMLSADGAGYRSR
ncbi:hypothetical protein CKO19_17085 [Rhodovulum adriaticum]|nr:hypothetical protein [Rhodovulum adriaticum]